MTPPKDFKQIYLFSPLKSRTAGYHFFFFFAKGFEKGVGETFPKVSPTKTTKKPPSGGFFLIFYFNPYFSPKFSMT